MMKNAKNELLSFLKEENLSLSDIKCADIERLNEDRRKIHCVGLPINSGEEGLKRLLERLDFKYKCDGIFDRLQGYIWLNNGDLIQRYQNDVMEYPEWFINRFPKIPEILK